MKTVKNSGCNKESENNDLNAAPAQKGKTKEAAAGDVEDGEAEDNEKQQNTTKTTNAMRNKGNNEK